MGIGLSAPSGRPALDKVLLVEDNLVIAMNTEALLQELGVEHVMIATSLPTAMDLVGAHQFDLAILDLDLDGETSIPVAERLLKAHVPIIISTGYNDRGLLPADFSDVPLLKKPFTFVELKRLVLHD